MTASILDGRALASRIEESLRGEVATFAPVFSTAKVSPFGVRPNSNRSRASATSLSAVFAPGGVGSASTARSAASTVRVT